MHLSFSSFGLAAAGVVAATLLDAKPADIKEWPVPWENSRPRDPYVAPDGNVWFVGQRSDYVAYLVPGSGEFKRFELDPGTGPHNLIVDASGMVWYAGNRTAHIGRLDPATGRITKYPMPDPAARDPHTLVFDSRGDIWFTLQGAKEMIKNDSFAVKDKVELIDSLRSVRRFLVELRDKLQ